MVRSPADIKQCDWRDFRGIMQMDTHGGTSFLVVFLRKWTYPTVHSTFLFLIILINFLANFGGRAAPWVLCENWWPHWGRKRQNSAVSHPNIVGNLASWSTQLCRTQTTSHPEEARYKGKIQGLEESWALFVWGPRDKRCKSVENQIVLLPLFIKQLVLHWILPCCFSSFLWGGHVL